MKPSRRQGHLSTEHRFGIRHGLGGLATSAPYLADQCERPKLVTGAQKLLVQKRSGAVRGRLLKWARNISCSATVRRWRGR
jgi:hypothetical protein